MIKSELRIGILVYDSLRRKQIEIQLKHFRELSISEKCFFERYNPIPLTEEILLKFGFKKGVAGYEIEGLLKTGRWIEKKRLFDVEICETSFLRYDCLKDIFHVHQLQNFYFSIIGKELIEKKQQS